MIRQSVRLTINDVVYLFEKTLQTVDEASTTFRRLFNFSHDHNHYDPDNRRLLGAGESFKETITEKIHYSGRRRIIDINMEHEDKTYTDINGEKDDFLF